ncbi:MAG: ROK family protein [Actinomycetota bacterium]|nr:ROK family protein [Actinomycetota bacterium]
MAAGSADPGDAATRNPGRRGLGVDIGGSGIKGGLVDLDAGVLIGERHRIDTPQPATPRAVGEVAGRIVEHFGWTGEVGLTLPAVIVGGVARTAANIDPAWIGTQTREALGRCIPGPVEVLNDADAAGLAEVRYGAARDVAGVVLVLTFGTGIGSALFVGGRLVPNTELGHIDVGGEDGETLAAASVRERLELSWPQWAARVEQYLQRLERFLWPDLIVVGGGVSKRADKWLPLISHRTPIVPAQLQNAAGIVGAALAAAEDRGY